MMSLLSTVSCQLFEYVCCSLFVAGHMALREVDSKITHTVKFGNSS